MRLTYIENRILKLETHTHEIDECALVIGAMEREHYRCLEQPCPEHALDSELNRLAALSSLPRGVNPLLSLAHEILHNAEAQLCE